MLEKELVGFVSGLSYEDLPPAAVAAARRETLWTLGTSVAGSGAEGSDLIRRFATDIGGSPQATVLGVGDRLPASVAGFVNGCFAKALEYEDKLWIDDGHGYAIGTSVVPAALATAELVGGVDGRTLLAAVASATDVQARLVRSVHGLLESGWNGTYIFGALGAAMAAGKLLGLTETELTNALGLAYAQVCGNFQGQVEGVLGVRMQSGFGVRNGISAAQLAKLGATGTAEFLTGRYGMFRLHFGALEVDEAYIVAGLGTDFHGTRLGYKAYPCGAVAHPALDALRSLELAPGQEIAGITVFATPRAEIMCEPAEHRRAPRSHVEAQFSLPWVVACVAVDGDLRLRHFEDEALADQRIRSLAGRIEVDLSGDRGTCYVEVELAGGKTLRSAPVGAAKGHGSNPQTTDELVDRYRDCVTAGAKPLDESRTEQAKDLILRLEGVDDVRDVVALLA